MANNADKRMYRMEMQKKGIKLPPLPAGVPSNATPITKTKPSLGAKPISHPHLAGKKPI